MEERMIRFESLADAEKFVKAHNIKFFHYKTSRKLGNAIELVIEKTFICEICKEETPFEYEGTEPNTCAMCMPFSYEQIKG